MFARETTEDSFPYSVLPTSRRRFPLVIERGGLDEVALWDACAGSSDADPVRFFGL